MKRQKSCLDEIPCFHLALKPHFTLSLSNSTKKRRWVIKVFNSICYPKSSWTVSKGAPSSTQHLYRGWQIPGKAASTDRQRWKGRVQEVKDGGGGEGSLLPSTSFRIENRLPRFPTNVQQWVFYYSLEPFTGFTYSSSQASSLDACTILIKQHHMKRSSSLRQERNLLRGFSFQRVCEIFQKLQTDFRENCDTLLAAHVTVPNHRSSVGKSAVAIFEYL